MTRYFTRIETKTPKTGAIPAIKKLLPEDVFDLMEEDSVISFHSINGSPAKDIAMRISKELECTLFVHIEDNGGYNEYLYSHGILFDEHFHLEDFSGIMNA